MSSANSIAVSMPAAAAAPQQQTRAAIARAAAETGVDFGYLIGQAKLESSMDPMAQARTSSAAGLYQFIDSTWLETMDRHGARLGFGSVADAIQMRGGRARISDPAQRDTIMAMRFDPEAAALMAGALAADNRAALMPVLGREPEPAELYMAHFLGAGGAAKFFSALQQSPEISAASILPKAATSNRGVFYTSGGAARSVQGVMKMFEGKMSAAMEGAASAPAHTPSNAGMPAFGAAPFGAFGITQPFGEIAGFTDGVASTQMPTATSAAASRAARPAYRPPLAALGSTLPSMPVPETRAQPASMADIVRGSFGELGSLSPQANAQISRAYTKLEAFGL